MISIGLTAPFKKQAVFLALLLGLLFLLSLASPVSSEPGEPGPGVKTFDLAVSTACNSTTSKALLSWNPYPSGHDYAIYRCEGMNCIPSPPPQVMDLPAHIWSYTDTGLVPGTVYRYKIEVFDVESNLLAESSEQGATTCSVSKTCSGSTPSISIFWRSHYNPATGEGGCTPPEVPVRQIIRDDADNVVFQQDLCKGPDGSGRIEGTTVWNGAANNTHYTFAFKVPIAFPWNYDNPDWVKTFTFGGFLALQCGPPLQADLLPNSSSDQTPLTVNFTGQRIGGDDSKTTYYTFWWNCDNPDTTYSGTRAACGDPNSAFVGQEMSSGPGVNGVTTSNQYPTGNYKPKLLVSQQGPTGEGAIDRADVTVTSAVPVCGNGVVESGEQCDNGGSNGACPATCSASCTINSCAGALQADLLPNSSSDQTPLTVNFTGQRIGGDDSKTTYYTFWWNCDNPDTTYSGTRAACGDPNSAFVGQEMSSGPGVNGVTTSNQYPTGNYKPKLLVSQQGPTGEGAIDRADVAVSSVAETLSVSLSANPNSGAAPLNGVDLTAIVSGIAQGTINYKFDCTNDGSYEHVFNNISDNPKTVIDACNYSSVNTYTARVFVERGTAPSAEGTATITVNPGALQADLLPNSSLGPSPLTVNFTGQRIGGDDSKTTYYTFWWNCDTTDTTYSGTRGAPSNCDDPGNSAFGQEMSSGPGVNGVTTSNQYSTGNYKPKLLVSQQGPTGEGAIDRADVVVGAPLLSLTASCAASPTNVKVGDPVTWLASPSGGLGAGTYSFLWSGSAPLAGMTTNPAVVSYSTLCEKTGAVKVTSGAQSVGPVACDNTVTVSSAAVSASPPAIRKTEQSTLTWNAPGFDRCGITDNFGNVTVPSGSPINGTKKVTPLVTTTYTLSCVAATGCDPDITGTDSTTVTVAGVPRFREIPPQ